MATTRKVVATKRAAPTTRRTATATAAPVKEKIRQVTLNEKADAEYYEYGVSVIEDRAIFGSLDGLKPVARRSLFAIHELGLHSKAKPDKSAKAVGATLGNYHPHGDKACYDAMVTAAANVPIPMIFGDGNWGTMTENAAAMRYTNLRLSKFADAVFFDKFYLPTVEWVPNYDGSRKEPLILPSLLPNALLNGNFGIAPGVNTRSPSFTLKSMIEVIKLAIANKGVCTPEMAMQLEFNTAYGGKAVRTKANKAEFAAFFKNGKGRVTYESTCGPVQPDNSIRFDQFAPIADVAKVMSKIEAIKGVAMTRDDSDKKDKYKTAFIVQFVRTLRGAELEKTVKAVKAAMMSTYTLDVKVTDRYVKEDGTGGAKLRPTTVPDLITFWLKYRIQLEKDACAHWVKERAKEIAYLQLMRLAITNLDFIMNCVKNKKLDDAQLVAAISKGLKITAEETNKILARNLRQLRHLEDQALSDKIKALEKERASYEMRIKRPAAYVLKTLDGFLELI